MTEGQSLVPLTAEEIAQARAITGEAQRQSGPQMPVVKFIASSKAEHGLPGEFHLCVKNDQTGDMEYTNLGTSISVVILRARKTADNGDKKPRRWIRECDSMDGQVTLQTDGESDVQTGDYRTFKQDYDLHYQEILYVHGAGKIAKLRVRGNSLSRLWKYMDSFGKNDTVMAWKTVINSEDVPNDYGSAKAMTFAKGEANPNFTEMVKLVMQLQKRWVTADKAALPTPADETEINIEDIPF
jgi:hypothetical protein